MGTPYLSNNTIAALLIATIVLYMGGLFLTLNKFVVIAPESGPVGALTSTATGNVTLRISSTTSITWTVATIEWGSGYVSGSCNNCTMFVNASADALGTVGSYNQTCCNSFNWSNISLLLKNNGNQGVALQMNVTNNRTNWWGTAALPSAFDFKVSPIAWRSHNKSDAPLDTVNGCSSSADAGGTASNLSWAGTASNDTGVVGGGGWTSLDTYTSNSTMPYLCGGISTTGNFSYAANANEAAFDFRVVIPQNYTSTGTFSAIITMLATS